MPEETPPVVSKRSDQRGASLVTRLIEWGVIVAAIAIFVLLRLYVYDIAYVPTGSMEPTLMPGDRLLVARRAYEKAKPEHGDIVVFNHNGHNYVKRVVGIPGEVVVWFGDRLFVNGRLVREPYVKYRPSVKDAALMKVEQGQVFVMGDNRDKSEDSRDWGPIPVSSIHGKVLSVYWPWERRRGVL